MIQPKRKGTLLLIRAYFAHSWLGSLVHSAIQKRHRVLWRPGISARQCRTWHITNQIVLQTLRGISVAVEPRPTTAT